MTGYPRLLRLGLLLLLTGTSSMTQADSCPGPGQWIAGDGSLLATQELMRDLSGRQVILLGEQHDQASHHVWQWHTLEALHARRPGLVIGLEMLPREAQPALDEWVAGRSSKAEFLEASGWSEAWGYDPELYWPILRFARQQGVPLKALNVMPALRKRLVDEGWQAVPAEERFGISAPAPASPAYRLSLQTAFEAHAGLVEARDAALQRFIDAQLVWDRVMADGLAKAAENGALVVGLMGMRHVSHGYGVPHQLDDLGLIDQRSLLPRSLQDACQTPLGGEADAFFILAE